MNLVRPFPSLSRLATMLAAITAASVGASGSASAQMPHGVARPDGGLVFDGVTVIDVEKGAKLTEQRVVVSGNRITAVGPAASVKAPAGAKVVDAKGKYLMPGLWDMHIHPGPWYPVFYPLFLANGVTGVRDAAAAIPLDTLLAWGKDVRNGTHVGPARIFLSGQSISEDPGCDRSTTVESHMTCVSSPADARHLVDSLKAAGATIIKPYGLNAPEIYYAIASESRRLGLPFGGHLTAVDAADAADSGAAILDHLNTSGGLDTICLAVAYHENTASAERCKPTAERMARNNSWHAPTLVIFASIGMLNAKRSEAILRRAKQYLEAFWDDTVATHTTTHTASRNWLRGPTDNDTLNMAPPSEVGILHIAKQVGLPMVVGTDASGGGVMKALGPGWGVHEELAMMVAEGVTPLEALQAGTINPAKALRITDSVGTVAAGKMADLILLDADPLADITNTTAIRAVVSDGRYYDRDALDKVLDDVRADAMTRDVISQ